MEDVDMFDHAHSGMAAAAAAAAGDAMEELAAKDKYGSLPSWNIVVICTVGGILFFELICHQMNHAAAGKRHAQELLETLYRELAILGVVAFILWSINVSPVVDIEYGDKHFFEQIHMALFLAALLHTFFVGVVALYSRQINRRWDIFEDDEMRRYKDLKQQHRRTAQRLGIRHASLKQGIGIWRSAWLTIRHPILYPRLSELSEHVGYHAIRAQFIKANHLPKNFRFASYLIKCEQSVVLNLAGIKEGVWVALILLAGAELFVKGILGEAESSKDVKPIFITGTCLVMLTAILVHFKLKDIYHTMIRSYSASTDRRDDFMQFLSPDAAGSMRQKDLFWFSSPGLMIVGLQSMQFLLAIMVGAVIWFGRTDSTGLMILAETILAVGAFGIYTVVLPKFIPKFTTVTHVGHMVDRHILSDCLVKQKKAFQHRSLPPTLRQVSEMARVKADDQAVNKTGFMYYLKKVMGGHAWREFVQVLITVHFFVVAYNTDPIEDGVDTKESFVAELSLGTAALFFELLGHFVIWGGSSFFRFSLFATVEEDSIVAKEAAARPAAAIHPSARQLLHNSDGSNDKDGMKKGGTIAVTQAPTGDDLQKPVTVNKATGTTGHYQEDLDYYHDEHQVRRCSVWACFGWNGEDSGKRIMSVPPSAQVGWWRTVDFLLVVAVAGCSIATFLSSGGTTRVIVHALQGLVILRWLPLMFCPFPPAAGHSKLHDVGGATVHHDPLDHHAREEVLRETLNLLRAQNKLSSTFDNNMHDEPLGGNYAETLNAKMIKKGPHEEEKAGDAAAIAADAIPSAEGIANVGVAVALREACAAHPDLVQSHGPLSAPILRAMLGIDPYKSIRQDDVQALSVAAGAFSLARGVQGADAPAAVVEAEVAGAVRAATPGRGHLRRQASRGSWYGDRPPSPSRMSNSSSSSSELSSSEEEGRRNGRKGSNATSTHRGRLSSWVGHASRHSRTSGASQSHHRLQLQQQQQILFQQQQQQQQMLYHHQQMNLHYQLQQQQRRGGGSVHDDTMSHMEGGTGFDTSHGGGPGSILSLDTGMAAAHAPPLLPGMTHPYMGGPFPGVGTYSLGGGTNPPAFEPTSTSSRHLPAVAGIQPRRSASVSGAKTSKSSRHHRGRSGGGSRSRRRSRSTSAGGGGGDASIVPPALEDMERPVLRSFASGGDHSQHGARSTATTPRSVHGLGPSGFSIPTRSGHSIPTGSGRSIIPFSSSHRATRVGPRGTPGRRAINTQSVDSAAESEVVGQAATEAAEATVASRRDRDRELDGHVASDATQAASSSASGIGDGSFTPSGSAAAASAIGRRDGNAE